MDQEKDAQKNSTQTSSQNAMRLLVNKESRSNKLIHLMLLRPEQNISILEELRDNIF